MSQHTFDPGKHLIRVSGRDYLEVKWRLVWMRADHPDAAVSTELVEHREGRAVFRARASLPGGGEATGWGSKTADDCEDYLEAAETKALGRALAALGYGTQFCEDFTQRSEEAGLAIVPFGSRRGDAAPGSPGPEPEPGRPRRARGARATEAQVKAIYAIGRQKYGWQENATDARSREHLGRPTQELTKEEASEFIDVLKAGTLGEG